jgi:REP element-mobilizing transposase RayT
MVSQFSHFSGTRRANWWDYRAEAAYFVTICTKDKECFFGEIENEVVYLSEIGKWVMNEWKITPLMRRDMNIGLGEYVVMPNHFHGIIEIGKNEFNSGSKVTRNVFGPQSKNLAAVIRGFKSAVTTHARKADSSFAWQPRYHESIIKDEKTYHKIRKYILDNPKNWNSDELRKL